MDSTKTNLHVIVIGCGIAGLAATCLIRERHPVTIYERAGQDVATGGHGISLFPNAVKLLDTIGFNHGKMKSDVEVDFLNRYGVNSLTMKRSDFRDELYRLATAPATELGIAVNPVKTIFHNGAVDVDPDTGEVTLADGSKDVGDVSELDVGKGRISLLEADDGTPIFITAYPYRRFDYMNLACNFPTRDDRRSAPGSWYAEAERGELLDTFGDFGEEIIQLLKVADDLKTWDLQDLDPLPTFMKGRTILIGDAAHAMSVLQGQGGNIAVEDGESFRLLAFNVTRDEVPAVLDKIDSIRRPRTKQVLADTRKMVREMSIEERFSRMDFNMSYNGIHDAIKKSEVNGDEK
ncbi:FAD binding domain protein [Ilyonectria destructans]|nr:FAD binding domain protein [Ilyonectria destructans]